MAKYEKWLHLILCMLILLQEVQLKRGELPEERRLLEDENNTALKVHHRNKRSLAWIPRALIAAGMLTSLGIDLAVAIEGCKAIRPSITGAKDVFDDMQTKMKTLYKEVNKLWLSGTTQVKYLDRMSDETQDLFDIMYSVDKYANAVSKALDSTIEDKVKQATENYTDYMKTINSTTVDFTDAVGKFDHVFHSAESAMLRLRRFVTWPVSMLLGKLLNLYIKRRIAAKAIAKNPYHKTGGVTPLNLKPKKPYVMKVFGLKITSTHLKRINRGYKVAMTSVFLALEAVKIVSTFESCADREDKIREETAKMTVEYNKMVAMKTTLTDTNAEIAEGYKNITDFISTDEFKLYITKILAITGSANAADSNFNAAHTKVTTFSENFQTETDMQNKETMVIDLISGLTTLSQTLECVTVKLGFVSKIESECTTGARTSSYKSAVQGINPTCASAKYITEAEVTTMVQANMLDNGYYAECKLNSADVQTQICTNHINGMSLAEITTKQSSTNTTAILDIISKCENAKVTDIVRKSICAEKAAGTTEAAAVLKFKPYSETEVKTVFKDCKIPLSDVQISYICKKKREQVTIAKIKTALSNYDQVHVVNEYNKCENIPIIYHALICMMKNNKKQSLAQVQSALRSVFNEADVKVIYEKCN